MNSERVRYSLNGSSEQKKMLLKKQLSDFLNTWLDFSNSIQDSAMKDKAKQKLFCDINK